MARLNKGPLEGVGFDRPDGVLLFLGPTGVGKVQLAKAVAEFLFGDEKKMIRVDMSVYWDRSVAVDKLIGIPRGIVGSERGGVLSESAERQPVLRDPARRGGEGETPGTLNVFLQASRRRLDSDSRGKRYLPERRHRHHDLKPGAEPGS